MATKKTSSRTKSKSAAATERERKKRELHSRQQFWAIVVFAVAVFIMATTLVEGQNVWNWIHNFFLGMFGWSAYLIAPLLFYVSIMTALDKPIGLVGHKVWQSMLLICLLSGATQVFGSGIPNGNLIEKFLSLFQNGVDGHGGGAVSGLFGLPLLYWFGPTGAKVTMVLLIFVVLMVLPGGMPGTTHLGESLTIQEGLAYAAQEDLWVAAICAAPSVLGENGLLHGRKYTCYPGFENDEKYHGTYTAAPLQQDGKIITANGAGNAMTFALYLLAALQGEEKALEVGRSIQMKL